MGFEGDSATLYVLVPPSPLFAAHWSFFIPDVLPLNPNKKQRRREESNIGRRIHVVGDRRNGFKLEIVRGFDLKKDRTNSDGRRFAIGVVAAANASDSPQRSESSGTAEKGVEEKDEDEGGGTIDKQAEDEFERVCVEIDAPGPSLRKISTAGSTQDEGTQARLEVKDCQWWVREVVNALVKRGILLTAPWKIETDRNSSPTVIVEALPKH
ncbi:MAG: hypothetical protein M1831_001820 [Alyxoria varia]|nr:MAG: hypothetical protein M1831_001820 [Alyxoria varia]